MKIARDLMTPEPIHADTGTELETVVDIFLNKNFKTIPVVHKSGMVAGMLSEFGIIKAFLNHHFKQVSTHLISHHMDLLERPVIVKENDAVTDVIKALARSRHRRLLVTDEKEKLLGIISPKDILSFIVGEKTKTKDMHDTLKETSAKVDQLKDELVDAQDHVDMYVKLFNDSPYMIHSADQDGNIVMANKKIHEVLGYQPGELIGQTIYDIYPATNHTAAKESLAKIVESGTIGTVFTSMVTKEKWLKSVDISSSSLKDQKGNFMCTISISREIDSETLMRALGSLSDVDTSGISMNVNDEDRIKTD